MASAEKSYLTAGFRRFIDFLNRYFTLSAWFIRKDENVFYKVELFLFGINFFCLILLFTIHLLPLWLGSVFCVLLVQRVIEFFAVYAKNFIFNQGRVFTHFQDNSHRGQWLLLSFILNAFQLALIFSIWYRFLYLVSPEAFSSPMTILNSFYFSVVTFMTVGYGDIIPLTAMAKGLVIFQSLLLFYIFVIVVNGLISIHFSKRD